MQTLDKILVKFEENVARGMLLTLTKQAEPIEFFDLMQASQSSIQKVLNADASLRMIVYEGILHRLRVYGYLTIVHDGENLDRYFPLSIYDKVSLTPEGKSFFEENYMVAQ